MPVPNKPPVVTSVPYRIAIVGEAPGKDDIAANVPFTGAPGRLLNGLLSKANILRDACYVGNVCQHHPPNNVIAAFDWNGDEIQLGIAKLLADLQAYRPNLILCLGATALHLFKEGNRRLTAVKPKGSKDAKFKYPNSIDSWRGSLFMSSPRLPLPPTKCLAAHHPAFCLRAYENTSLLMFDIHKARVEGESPNLELPLRDIIAFPSAHQVIHAIEAFRRKGTPLSLDIEGYYHGMTCISIAASAEWSLVIPFQLKDGSSYWSFDDELLVTRALAELLADPNVPKTWQNGLYDRWVLQYGYSMPVYGNDDDTMLMWWEKYCELPKGLATQASILTNEPYYKSDRKSDNDEVRHVYCGKDSAITMEIRDRMAPMLTGPAFDHYRLNHSLLNVFLYIELRGIQYNTRLAKQRAREVEEHIYILQDELDRLTGCGLPSDIGSIELESMVRDVMCWKKDPSKAKADFVDVLDEALLLCNKDTLTPRDRGFLSTAMMKSMNIKSPQFKNFLYKKLNLPVQINKATGSETADGLALLKLSKKHPHRVLDLAIQIALLRTRSQMLQIHADPDGRMRCGYNVVGAATGRITCYTSPTGSGYNLQTLPDNDKSKPEGHPLRHGMRDLILADDDHWFFQCDLKGSDGWTIGAHLNRLGDSTMLDDLRYGIKPASRICYMLRHGIHSLKNKSRAEIVELLKEVKGDDWDYFACKIGIWGLCYSMGPDTLADNIYEESDGKLSLSRKEIADFRTAVFEGYHIKMWHAAMQRHLLKSPTLTSASGHTRRFFGRPQEILGAALAHEPQANTTYATNLAAYRLWNDPENRTNRYVMDNKGKYKSVPFRIEPLHQVHDALLGQFQKDDTEWAIGKIKSYFNNPLIIAGQEIIIPYDGKFGPSWGEQPHKMP